MNTLQDITPQRASSSRLRSEDHTMSDSNLALPAGLESGDSFMTHRSEWSLDSSTHCPSISPDSSPIVSPTPSAKRNCDYQGDWSSRCIEGSEVQGPVTRAVEEQLVPGVRNIPLKRSNAPLRACAAIIGEPGVGPKGRRAKKSTQPAPSRSELLQIWRARVGLSLASTVSPHAPGCPNRPRIPAPQASAVSSSTTIWGRVGLPTKVLHLIVQHMLAGAPQKTRPRAVLAAFGLASRQFQNIAAPYIYENVILRGNGDVGVYVRMDHAKHVRSLTIKFEPKDPWSPYSALLDQRLHPSTADNSKGYPRSGIEYFFPHCTEMSFVVDCTQGDPRSIHLASTRILGPDYGEPADQCGEPGRSMLYRNPNFLGMKLMRLVPKNVKHVTLDGDIPGVGAAFTSAFMERHGDPEDEIRLDLVSRRDDIVQSIEHVIHNFRPKSPNSISRTRIVIHGPTHGVTIDWNGSSHKSIIQGVWDRASRVKVRTSRSQTKPVVFPSPTYGPDAPRRSTRRSTSPYKRPIPNAPAREPSPPPRSKTLNSMRTIESRDCGTAPSGSGGAPGTSKPRPSGASASKFTPGETEAWHAGRIAAEVPSIIEKVITQVNQHQSPFKANTKGKTQDDRHADFWTYVDTMSEDRARIGVWCPVARGELDKFVRAYRERNFSAHMRVVKLSKKQEQAEAAKEREAQEKLNTDAAVANQGRRPQKRRRRA